MSDPLTLRETDLLLAILCRDDAPDELTARAASNDLTRQERQRICHLIMNEFSRVGLGNNYEPNPLGIELEALLDTINRPNLRDG
jgi:hypothetical protein